MSIQNSRWAAQLDAGLGTMGIAASPEQKERWLAFLTLLMKWNKAYNLTAVRDPAEVVARQLLDSLSILPWFTAEALLDVGAGGGLPGIPLAILFPGRQFTLLDSNGKKTRFLTQCKLDLGLDNLTVVQARADEFQPPQAFSQISSRAFTALPNLVAWCAHLLAPGGQFLAMKGQYPENEVAALPAPWQVEARHGLQVPGCEAERHLLIIARPPHTGA